MHIADEVERARIEVELRVALGAAFITTRGFGAPEVLDAYSRAEALCDRLGERADLFPAIWGQWMFRTGQGETNVGRRRGARLLALSPASPGAGLFVGTTTAISVLPIASCALLPSGLARGVEAPDTQPLRGLLLKEAALKSP
jgi:hypothetical protein